MSGLVSGGVRFNISMEYSVHRAPCVSSDINSFPSLSSIGVSNFFLNRPQTCFVILYSVTWSLLCAASSAWVAIFSRYLRLSRRVSCLTVRSASLYTCFCCSLSRSDFIPSSFFLKFSSFFYLLPGFLGYLFFMPLSSVPCYLFACFQVHVWLFDGVLQWVDFINIVIYMVAQFKQCLVSNF